MTWAVPALGPEGPQLGRVLSRGKSGRATEPRRRVSAHSGYARYRATRDDLHAAGSLVPCTRAPPCLYDLTHVVVPRLARNHSIFRLASRRARRARSFAECMQGALVTLGSHVGAPAGCRPGPLLSGTAMSRRSMCDDVAGEALEATRLRRVLHCVAVPGATHASPGMPQAPSPPPIAHARGGHAPPRTNERPPAQAPLRPPT